MRILMGSADKNKDGVLTRELLSSNVGLAPNADDSATVALATDISLGMGGFA